MLGQAFEFKQMAQVKIHQTKRGIRYFISCQHTLIASSSFPKFMLILTKNKRRFQQVHVATAVSGKKN